MASVPMVPVLMYSVTGQPGNDVGQRLDAGGVLHLVQADDVGIQAGKRLQQFIALAGELSRLVAVPAAAFHVVERAALVIQRVAGRVIGSDEVVERVHRRHAQRCRQPAQEQPGVG